MNTFGIASFFKRLDKNKPKEMKIRENQMYLDLCSAFLLIPLASKAEHQRALNIFEALIDVKFIKKFSDSELKQINDYMCVLSLLINLYEAQNLRFKGD